MTIAIVIVAVLGVCCEVFDCLRDFLRVKFAVYVAHCRANDAPFDGFRGCRISIQNHCHVVFSWALIENVATLLWWIAVGKVKETTLLVRSAEDGWVALYCCQRR